MFYTSFSKVKNELLIRGYDSDDNPFFIKRQLEDIHLYEEIQDKSQADAMSIVNTPLHKHTFKNTWKAREFIKNHHNPSKIYGYPHFDYSKINELFTNEYKLELIKTAFIDIETFINDDADAGTPIKQAKEFPSTINPVHPISLITTIISSDIFIYSLIDIINKDKIISKVSESLSLSSSDKNYQFHFKSFSGHEDQLIKSFILLIDWHKPDIICGYNSDEFDIPYICNRSTKILNFEWTKRLSPFGEISSREYINSFGEPRVEFDIKGVQLLDYLKLYKKFELSPRENYKLDTISELELNHKKLSYEGSFQSFYNNDWPMFVAYNIIDTLLVQMLDDTLGFIAIAASMAYMSKCNYTDVFRVTRIWDNTINNFCQERNIQVPTEFSNERRAYEGAYVKPTIAGKYKVVVSYDATSLYPSVILKNNISPETILPTEKFCKLNAHDVIERNANYDRAIKVARENNAALCANGAMFSKESQGILPTLIMKLMKDRSNYKKDRDAIAIKVEYAKEVLLKNEHSNNI